jgi:endonuclease/exonuclease/phosphatase (EEP) superfamily protein YafD
MMMRKFLLGLSGLYCLVMMIYIILRLLAGDTFWWLALAHNFMPYCFVPAIFVLILGLIIRARPLAGWGVVLLVIGTLWFLPMRIGSPSTSSPDDLVVISFNVYQHNETMKDVEDWLLLKNADVIVLQQLDKGLISLRQAKWAYPYRYENVGTETSAILSRWPITASGEVTLSGVDHPWVKIDVNGRSVTVYDIHLDAPVVYFPRFNPPMLVHYDEQQRNAEIDDLVAHITSTADPYVIVAGDFNLNEFSPAYNRLDAILDDTYRQTRGDYGATWPAGASEELPNIFPILFRYDYVWYNSGIRAVTSEVGPSLGSDHRPVFAALALGETP